MPTVAVLDPLSPAGSFQQAMVVRRRVVPRPGSRGGIGRLPFRCDLNVPEAEAEAAPAPGPSLPPVFATLQTEPSARRGARLHAALRRPLDHRILGGAGQK